MKKVMLYGFGVLVLTAAFLTIRSGMATSQNPTVTASAEVVNKTNNTVRVNGINAEFEK